MSDVLRAPREEDARAIAGLLSKDSPEPIDAEAVLLSWTSPGVQLQHDARADEHSYARVESLGQKRVWISLGGHPSVELFDWVEARAREKGSRLLSGAWASNATLIRELERRDFRLVRTSNRMTIELHEPRPDPVWPQGVEVRIFEPGDERVFYELHQETFRDSWEPIEESYDEWAHWHLQPRAFVPDLWFLGVAGAEPVGFAICHSHPVDAELGWVRILGVRREWRRRGLGRGLLLHAFAEFRRRGMKRAALGVDAESLTGANRLYEQAGMYVAARFAIYEKVVA